MLTSIWPALIVAGVAVLLLASAVWTSIRVLGRITAVRQAQLIIETSLEQLDVRLTREVKTRAGLTRAEGVVEDKSVIEEARAILAKDNPPLAFPERPKRSRRNF